MEAVFLQTVNARGVNCFSSLALCQARKVMSKNSCWLLLINTGGICNSKIAPQSYLTRNIIILRNIATQHTMAEIGMICTRPGCDQPGPSLCASCRLVGYCCRTCQVEDWQRHKETDCQGHLRKIGMAHLQKAKGCRRDRNWAQTVRYSDLALVKLKQLNDRPIEDIDSALRLKFNALNFMDRNREAMECAKERYCLYLTSHTHPPAIEASFCLIESCIHNEEYEDAALYARTTWETITLSRDSHIPDNELQWFTAQGAYYLSRAMFRLATSGDIPPEANQTAGQEAIGLARRALEINTQLNGLEHASVANNMSVLADALVYFNNVDDDEVLRLYEQSISITARVEGSLSVNVAVGNRNLAIAKKIEQRELVLPMIWTGSWLI